MALYNNYNSAQIMSMQNDAIRRVNEMQRRSKEKISGETNIAPQTNTTAKSDCDSSFSPDEHCNSPNTNGIGGFLGSLVNHGENALTGILDKLNLDSEVILILLMMLLLANEGADMMLLLALVYIML